MNNNLKILMIFFALSAGNVHYLISMKKEDLVEKNDDNNKRKDRDEKISIEPKRKKVKVTSRVKGKFSNLPIKDDFKDINFPTDPAQTTPTTSNDDVNVTIDNEFNY